MAARGENLWPAILPCPFVSGILFPLIKSK
uniref:Uncharacterized protein n=1 Tax=Arundo donax TaxID=35708 RepID=A0A0A9ACD6_ARUDO